MVRWARVNLIQVKHPQFTLMGLHSPSIYIYTQITNAVSVTNNDKRTLSIKAGMIRDEEKEKKY